MPKVKVKRKSTFIDMTAMSDVTVLLLTFFMLTSTFIKKEPVQVVTPSSVADIKIPETNILTVLVDTDGKVFMSLDKQEDKQRLLREVGNDYQINFTDEELYRFGLSPSFGAPISKMKAFLALSGEKQDEALKTLGIPTDSIDNQFKTWVKRATEINPELIIAIKADAKTPYSTVKNVMGSLQEMRINRFNLITTLKTSSSEE